MTTTLLHAPLACSLAARFAAAEGEVPLTVAYVNLRTKMLASGGSLLDINPLGQVSTLQLDDGSTLTETAAVILWIQAQSKNDQFRVDPADARYYQMVRWLGFCATELHKQIFRVVFYNEATDEVKARVRGLAPARFALLDGHLANRRYLLGDTLTAADAYLAWFFVLAENARVDAADYRHLVAYRDRVLARPKIAELIASDIAKGQALDQRAISD